MSIWTIKELFHWLLEIKKKADEAVEDEIGVSKPSKCPFSHAEAMQKMDDYLAYYRSQPEATP